MQPSPFHLRVLHFTFDNLALTYNKFMQLVTPSVVAMAVRKASSTPMTTSTVKGAFRNGNLGVMDYYKLENIKADTQMREGISKVGQSNQPKTNSK